MTPDPFALDDYCGTARLFPLPNLVLYPQVAQPLHIFEARYRQLMADALAGDRLIAMALLRPGWEQTYHQAPPIHPMICLGRIAHQERLADGRYNLVLQGISRARVREEVQTGRLYRTARADIVCEVEAAAPAEATLRQELAQGVKPFFAAHPQAWEQFRDLLDGPMTLGGLCDVVAYALPLDLEVKQELLNEARVEERVQLLLARLAGQAPPPRAFPPGFSAN